MLGATTVQPGSMLSITLAARDNSTFKGFIIQARDQKLKDQQVGGSVQCSAQIIYALQHCRIKLIMNYENFLPELIYLN